MEIWTHKTGLTLTFFIKEPVHCQDIERYVNLEQVDRFCLLPQSFY